MFNPARTILLTVCTLLAGGTIAEARGQAEPQLLEFQVIYSEKGPNWTSASTPALDSLQQAHMEFRLRLIKEGKLLVAGPFDTQDSDVVRGMTIGCRLTREEATALLSADPKVRSGHLVMRLVTWFVPATAVALAECGLPVN
jgi:uncharacterized protein YciI